MKGIMAGIVARQFEPMFPIELVAKDFSYVIAQDDDPHTRLPTACAAHDVFVRAARTGFGGDNIHGVAKLYATS